MLNNQTTYQNQAVIRGLLKGEVVQYKSKTDLLWCDYNTEDFLNGDSFGPWNSADEYRWRIKPKTTEITLTVDVTVTKHVKFEFEGVKKELYVEGEEVFYIHKSQQDNSYCKNTIRGVNHNENARHQSYVVFETEEAMNKAYEQIINAQQGL